ncbi:MAG: sigma-70 family RNA polymerase sigma factor [Bacteroidales bacterium]|nr:sigma-70 family RNA polymerase sigma factor [Bacteroidales bacterium]
MSPEDNTIIELILGRDKKQGFELLVQKYQEKIYWLIRRMVMVHEDADDLVQEVFVKVWLNIHRFRKDSALFTWLYRTATNETLTFLKKQKRKKFISDPNEKLLNALQDDNWFKGEDIEGRFYQALVKLPEKQRIVFNMKYFDEMKYEDMSEILSTSVGALKASFHLARKKIENFLTEN